MIYNFWEVLFNFNPMAFQFHNATPKPHPRDAQLAISATINAQCLEATDPTTFFA